MASSILVLAVFGLVILGCALAFPNRREELSPELWEGDLAPRGIAVAAE